MREDTVTTIVYKFDELSDEAKATAVLELSDINVFHEWWESTYEDAATVGLKLTSFDDHSCEGEYVDDAESTAQLILEHHGETCETHKDATVFLDDVETAAAVWKCQPGYNAEYDDDFEDTDQYEELCSEFLKTLREDYRIMLSGEYEYLCGEEAITESIKANEYEFTEAGNKY